MRIPSDRLTTKALLALEEVARQADREPVRPSLAVRFALAYLYSVGSGEREPFDRFWLALAYGGNDYARQIERGALVSAALSAIYLQAGRERTPAMMFYSTNRTQPAVTDRASN